MSRQIKIELEALQEAIAHLATRFQDKEREKDYRTLLHLVGKLEEIRINEEQREFISRVTGT